MDEKLTGLAREMAASIHAAQPLPKLPPGLDLETAYEVQRAVVEIVAGDAVAGLKAGMTAPAAQAAFGLHGPVIGALYEAGRLVSGTDVTGGAGVSLECEIGIVVDGDGAPQSAGPVVEVPRLAFADEADRTGANLVACNIAADRFIVGKQLPWRDVYGDVRIALTRQGEMVTTAPASDALGGPHAALAWMLEEARKRGMAVTNGMLLITGACGGIHPALPGPYVADYGDLGRIEFDVI